MKKFHRWKIWSIFKGFDREIVSFQKQKDFPAREFDRSLQIVGCMATERYRMKIKILPSVQVTRKITPISGYITWFKPAARAL